MCNARGGNYNKAGRKATILWVAGRHGDGYMLMAYVLSSKFLALVISSQPMKAGLGEFPRHKEYHLDKKIILKGISKWDKP